MAEFKYQEPFPIENDTTVYRLLTKDYVKSEKNYEINYIKEKTFKNITISLLKNKNNGEKGVCPLFPHRLQKLIFFEFYCIVLCEVDINENFDSYRPI